MTTAEAKVKVREIAKLVGGNFYEYAGIKYVTFYGKTVYRLKGTKCWPSMIWIEDLNMIQGINDVAELKALVMGGAK